MTHVFKAAAIALVVASPLSAETRFKTDATVTYDETGKTIVNPSMRVIMDGSEDNRRYEYQMLFSYLQSSEALTALPATPPSTMFNMTNVIDVSDNAQMTMSVERAAVSFTTDQTVLKIGRQALTWGQGTGFNPGDFVAPAAGASFKPGVDMIYGQYLFDNGSDIQAVYVPRPATEGGQISRSNSTLALRGFTTLGMTDFTLTVGEDRGDLVTALGFSSSLGGLGVKGEIVNWDLASGSAEPSWVLSAMGFGSWGDWGTTYSAELFHNGFGVAPSNAYSAELLTKMSTGHVYLPNRDYLLLGGSIMFSPEFSIAPSAIISLEDQGALLGLSASYVLGDNADLSVSLSAPTGAGLGLGKPQSVSFVATQYF